MERLRSQAEDSLFTENIVRLVCVITSLAKFYFLWLLTFCIRIIICIAISQRLSECITIQPCLVNTAAVNSLPFVVLHLRNEHYSSTKPLLTPSAGSFASLTSLVGFTTCSQQTAYTLPTNCALTSFLSDSKCSLSTMCISSSIVSSGASSVSYEVNKPTLIINSSSSNHGFCYFPAIDKANNNIQSYCECNLLDENQSWQLLVSSKFSIIQSNIQDLLGSVVKSISEAGSHVKLDFLRHL